jgi:stage V sporulation protein G
MKITCKPQDIRLNPNGNSKKAAFASITLDEAFVVHGLSITNGNKGLFVSMPQASYTNQNGEKVYKDTAFPLSKALRDEINDAVMGAYHEKLHENANSNTNTNAQESADKQENTNSDSQESDEEFEMY